MGSGGNVSDLKILVVDDTPIMRNIIVKTLRRAGYLNVTPAVDARDALDKLQTDSFDFIITDWKMPQMDGLGLVQAIRSDPQLKSLPVLIVTHRIVTKDGQRARKAGANNYIVKPFTSVTLANKIKQVLKSV